MGLNGIRAEFAQMTTNLLLNTIAGNALVPSRGRYLLYKLFGVDVKKSLIAPHCFLGSRNISIGRGVYLNRDCYLSGGAPIVIADNCSIGVGTKVINVSHALGPQSQRAGERIAQPVTIGEGTWVGAGVIILPGIEIGRGAVIGAGAVVTRSCVENGLYTGVPARFVRALDEPEESLPSTEP